MRTIIIAFLAFLFAASSFAQNGGNADTGKVARDRDVKKCQEYALQSMDSDTKISNIFASDGTLREYVSNVVKITCLSEATRRIEKEIHELENIAREVEKLNRNKKARASKIM